MCGGRRKESAKRLWLDGCFDGFHYAHANAIRQCLALVGGPVEIVIGVHPDDEIIKSKGPPLFNEKERYAVVAGCRWVSQVVEGVPYVTHAETIRKYAIDYVVHGDDPATDAEGNDCYAVPKAMGKYLEVKRTDGISTTSLVQRILSPGVGEGDDIRQRHEKQLRTLLQEFSTVCTPPLLIVDYISPACVETCDVRLSGRESWKAVGYVDGSWDCFSSGHVEVLRRAREAVAWTSQGQKENVRLAVGVWPDEDAESEVGEKPFLKMLERALIVAQCRYTDAIILSAPRQPTSKIKEVMIENLLAVRGGVKVIVIEAVLSGGNPSRSSGVRIRPRHSDPAKRRSETGTNEFVELDCRDIEPSIFTVASLREKVLRNKESYEERQRRKGYL